MWGGGCIMSDSRYENDKSPNCYGLYLIQKNSFTYQYISKHIAQILSTDGDGPRVYCPTNKMIT